MNNGKGQDKRDTGSTLDWYAGDADAGFIAVIFTRHEKCTQYFDVPADVIRDFLASGNKAYFLAVYLRGTYRYAIVRAGLDLPDTKWKNGERFVCRDGDQWCATLSDFVNLQESPAGFGNTIELAMHELSKQIAVEAST